MVVVVVARFVERRFGRVVVRANVREGEVDVGDVG